MGIEVLVPDVNESESDFTPRGDEILFGLAAVRGVGDGLVGDEHPVRILGLSRVIVVNGAEAAAVANSVIAANPPR